MSKKKKKNSHKRKHKKKKKSTFKKVNRFTRRQPVWTGMILILISIVLMRLSFTNVFLSSSEVCMWARILSIGLFITGIFVLNKYWRNNVLTSNAKHDVTWKNR